MHIKGLLKLENKMVNRFAIAGGVMFMLATAVGPASAVTVGPHSKALAPITVEDSLVKPVQWGEWRYCRYWRRQCAERWGWGTRRFYRCLERHGCGWGR